MYITLYLSAICFVAILMYTSSWVPTDVIDVHSTNLHLRKHCMSKRMSSSLFAATEIMMEDFQVKPNCDSIVLLWKPTIVPFQYTLNVLCRERNFERPYYKKSGINIRSTSTGYTITKLRPLSKCYLRFWAVYNNASADKGLSIKSNTLPSKLYIAKMLLICRAIFCYSLWCTIVYNPPSLRSSKCTLAVYTPVGVVLTVLTHNPSYVERVSWDHVYMYM